MSWGVAGRERGRIVLEGKCSLAGCIDNLILRGIPLNIDLRPTLTNVRLGSLQNGPTSVVLNGVSRSIKMRLIHPMRQH
jgi:hypothetical protein